MPAGAARGPPRRPGASPSSRPRGSWSTPPGARGSRGCPSRSRCRPRSARRHAGPAPAGRGRPPSPWRPWWHDATLPGADGGAAPGRRRRGPPAPGRRGAARPGLPVGRPGRLRARVLGRPHMCGAGRRPGRPHPGPPQRHADPGRARPPGRRRPARPAHLRPGGPGPAVRRHARRPGPVPAHPADALHLGHDGAAQGRHDGHLGRGDGTRTSSRTRRRSGTSTPTTSTWCARPCTTRSPSASRPARCSRAGPWPS